MDIALLFTAQEIGHYKIAIYKGTKSLAQQAGQSHIADILKTILGQEDESEKSLERLSHTLTTGLTQAQTN